MDGQLFDPVRQGLICQGIQPGVFDRHSSLARKCRQELLVSQVKWRSIGFVDHFYDADRPILNDHGDHQQILGRKTGLLIRLVEPVFAPFSIIGDDRLAIGDRFTYYPGASALRVESTSHKEVA